MAKVKGSKTPEMKVVVVEPYFKRVNKSITDHAGMYDRNVNNPLHRDTHATGFKKDEWGGM